MKSAHTFLMKRTSAFLMKRVIVSFMLILLSGTLTAWAQKPPIRVRFPRGRTTVVLHGSVSGDIDRYLLNARAGQQMTVHLTSARGDVEADVWMPNSDRVAEGGQGTKDWSGTLPKSGDCWIVVSKVGLGRASPYTLEVTIR